MVCETPFEGEREHNRRGQLASAGDNRIGGVACKSMISENRQLVTDEPVEFEK